MAKPKLKAKPAPKLKRDQTAEEIAEIFDIDIQTVRLWCRDEGCPHGKDGRELRLNDAEVRHWMTETNRTGKVGRPKPPPPENPEDSKDYWLARKYKIQCLREEGKLVDKEEYRRAWLDQVFVAKSAFLRMPAEVAASLVGHEAPDIERILSSRVEGIMRQLSGQDQEDKDGTSKD